MLQVGEGIDYAIKEPSIGRERATRCVWRVDEWMKRRVESDSSWNGSKLLAGVNCQWSFN